MFLEIFFQFTNFDSNKFFIQDLPMGEILYKGPNEKGLYPIPTSLSTKKSPQPQFTSYPSYGNLSQEYMAAMASLVILIIKFWSQHYHLCFLLFNQILLSRCTHCLKGKMHHLPFHVSSSQSRGPLDLVCHDVWGLASITSVNNFHYYLLFLLIYKIHLVVFTS